MKKRMLFMLVVIGYAAIASANLVMFDSTFGESIAIPDDDELGITDTIEVSGLDGTIADITVSLDITGTGDDGAYNGDYYAYLLHESEFCVLLNRTGKTAVNPMGSSGNGFEVTFTLSGADVHSASSSAGESLTGSWGADGRNIDPDLVVDTSPRTALLDVFSGTDPSGTWTLFVADTASAGTAQLNGWSVGVEAVPEPAVASFISIFGLTMLVVKRFFCR